MLDYTSQVDGRTGINVQVRTAQHASLWFWQKGDTQTSSCEGQTQCSIYFIIIKVLVETSCEERGRGSLSYNISRVLANY